MDNNHGILISNKDSDVNKLENIIFTTKYATAKLDTSKNISFRNIILTINTDPPEPANPPVYQKTRIATMPHGYNYNPSFWSLINILLPVSSTFDQDYFQEAGVVSKNTAFDEATFIVSANNQNIYFDVLKYSDIGAGGSTNNISGLKLKIRLYVFAEDLDA